MWECQNKYKLKTAKLNAEDDPVGLHSENSHEYWKTRRFHNPQDKNIQLVSTAHFYLQHAKHRINSTQTTDNTKSNGTVYEQSLPC